MLSWPAARQTHPQTNSRLSHRQGWVMYIELNGYCLLTVVKGRRVTTHPCLSAFCVFAFMQVCVCLCAIVSSLPSPSHCYTELQYCVTAPATTLSEWSLIFIKYLWAKLQPQHSHLRILQTFASFIYDNSSIFHFKVRAFLLLFQPDCPPFYYCERKRSLGALSYPSVPEPQHNDFGLTATIKCLGRGLRATTVLKWSRFLWNVVVYIWASLSLPLK